MLKMDLCHDPVREQIVTFGIALDGTVFAEQEVVLLSSEEEHIVTVVLHHLEKKTFDGTVLAKQEGVS